MDAAKSMQIAAAGMKAQSSRMRVIAENIANANSTAREPGGDPYRRKIPVFEAEMNRELGVTTVSMTKVAPDMSDFTDRYDPSHPAADENGYVKMPNVSSLIESVDMREASRSYQANLNVVEAARSMLKSTVDLLKA